MHVPHVYGSLGVQPFSLSGLCQVACRSVDTVESGAIVSVVSESKPDDYLVIVLRALAPHHP